MDKDKLEKLIISSNEGDRLLAIEFLRKMKSEEIKSILSESTHGSWHRHSNIHYPTENSIDGAIKVDKGYIAYNGIIWYAEGDSREVTNRYTIFKDLVEGSEEEI